MCVEGSLRRFLLRACRYNDMCDGDFLFIYIHLNDPTVSAWSRGDTDDADAKQAFKYLLYVSLYIPFYKRISISGRLQVCM